MVGPPSEESNCLDTMNLRIKRGAGDDSLVFIELVFQVGCFRRKHPVSSAACDIREEGGIKLWALCV